MMMPRTTMPGRTASFWWHTGAGGWLLGLTTSLGGVRVSYIQAALTRQQGHHAA